MVKRLLILVVALVLFQISEVFSQITIGTVDAGPYTPGSSIAATFTIDPTTCIRPGNRFDLYLVRPDGTEIPTPIGSYNGFYSTFVNGVIPAGTPAGIGYKLRIKSTTPAFTSTDSAPFNIQTGSAPVLASVSSFPELAYDASGKAEVFGMCPGVDNTPFNFTNTSTASSVVSATVKNEISGLFEAPLSFTSTPPEASFTATLAHYTVFVISRLNGTVGTRAYLVVNNNINNSFGTSGSNIVCLPGGFLQYTVDLSETGIKNNFPGTTYEIKWGDANGTAEIYTRCDLTTGFVRHEYVRSSCGQPVYNTGNGNQYNVFGINISALSPFCPGAGAGLSTYVRVVRKPENSFTSPIAACTGSTVNFENTSIAGETETNTPNCIDNNVRYNWYVDGVRFGTNLRREDIFTHPFPTPGVYTIRLESVTTGQCKGVAVSRTICIQDPPRPAFDFNNVAKTGCAPFTIQAFDRSIIDARCNTDNFYNWIVNGPAPVQFDPTAKDPVFTFNTPGTYEVILEIQTASCGTVRTQIPQQIVLVDGNPRTELSRDTTLCGLGAFGFNTTPGPTRTILEGTQQTIPGQTYTWTVTDVNGNPLPASDYAFENSDLHDQYPAIRFNSYKTYKIKVVHVNSCGTSEDEQVITFLESPVPTIASQDTICYNTPINLTGTPSNNNYIGYTWTSSGNGTFTNDNTLTPTYTPGSADLTALRVTITLTLNTGLAGSCQYVPVSKEIIIRPNNTGVNTTQEICTGNPLNYTPTSTVPGSTFIWTASNPDGNASGFTVNGSGNITDVITNNNATGNAIVIYTITPSAKGCTGISYTLSVTVTPRPVITAVAANTTICSNTTSGVALSSNISGTTYTWTSSSPNGVTGGSNNPTPITVATIDDPLINNGTTQGSVTYTITPYSASGCPGAPVDVTINVDPAITAANAGLNASICDLTTYTLNGNVPKSNETGTWSLTSGQTGISFTNVNSASTGVDGLVAGQAYTFSWTIAAPGVCSSSSSSVTITVNQPTVPGATAGTPTTVCSGTNTGTITLTGNVGSVVGWESSPDGTTWSSAPNSTTTTIYTFNNLTGNTFFRAIVQNGGCTIERSTPTIITVSPASTVAKAGPDQVLCNERTAILAGNVPVNPGETGLWTIPAGAPSAYFDDATSPTTEVSNLIAGQTYRFVWTITGTGACGPTSDEVIITNNPPINQNISSTVTVVCNGQEVILNGSVPTGGNGTYTYQWESQVNTDPWRPQLSDGTDKDLVIILNTEGTVSFRRIVTSGGCTDTSNVWIINVRPAIKDNNITADQTICAGSAPQPLTGPVPIGGDGTFNYQWQSSPNGTVWTDISGANAIDYQPLTLTATTYFRRNASTAACGSLGIPSNTVKITVNPNARAEFSWTSDIGCFPFALPITVVEYPDRNATYTWFAGTTQIGTGPAFPGYTITGSNQSVTIRLTVTSSLGCTSDEMSHVFSTNQSVPASFNQNTTQGCGPLDVTFVNTSDLNAGATFRWNFGNGQTSTATNPPTMRFQPDASGKDTTYVVTLYSVTTCGTDSAKTNILVKSPPRPVFSPSTTSGCSPLTVNFSNNSPAQTGITYTFNFGDGTAPVQTTDRSTVTHIYRTTTTVRTFNATLTAVNECGTVTTTPYQIIVRPNTVNAQLVVNGPELIGCAPHTVTFDNNTTGATSYTIDFNDGSQPRVSIIAPERFQYTFNNPGTYKVLLTATNGCSTDTTSETIVVRAQPQTDFNAVNTLGCTGLAVKFTNTSTGAVSYSWNFGDGSPLSNEFEPTHIYTGTQEYYAVTLTATNALGCSMTIIKNQFIRIVQPPVAAFNVNPSTLISIPDYTFSFQDESTNNPSIWEWDFGDGTTSSQRNPSHTYLDTGTYKVTLKTTNQQGCFTTTFKNVTIKGVPGYLFVPNAFTPGDTRPELREFRAKGSGILSWRFGVFNKWGQLLWETTKLEEGRPAEGWDGTFKGTAMPQGVYYWKIDVKMVNGSEWKGMTYDSSPPKRTGAIHLIR